MLTLAPSEVSQSALLTDCKHLSRWICWAHHRDFQKNEKIPLNTAEYIDSWDEFKASDYQRQEIWMRFDEAWEKYQENDAIDGVGFVTVETPYCYVDIDNCVRVYPDRFEVSDEAYSVMQELESYTEFSTSHTGLHIVGRGKPPSYGWPEDSNLEVEVFAEVGWR